MTDLSVVPANSEWDQGDKRFPEPLKKQKLKLWEDEFRCSETLLPWAEISFKLCRKKEVEAAHVEELVWHLYMQNNHSLKAALKSEKLTHGISQHPAFCQKKWGKKSTMKQQKKKPPNNSF